MELLNRSELEAKYQKEFAKLSKSLRAELIRLAGSPPDITKVPREFWQKVDAESLSILILLMQDVYSLNATQHGIDRPFAERIGRGFAAQRAPLIAREFSQNSFSRAVTAQAKLSRPGSSLTRSEIEKISDTVFGLERGGRLVTTEFTSASVGGSEGAMKQLGKTSVMDLWITHPSRSQSGVCKICEPLHGVSRSLWSRIHPQGPPIHPHCCCEIRYVN